MVRCSTSLMSKGMPSKSSITCPLIYIQLAIIVRLTSVKCREGCKTAGSPRYCLWMFNLIQLTGKHFHIGKSFSITITLFQIFQGKMFGIHLTPLFLPSYGVTNHLVFLIESFLMKLGFLCYNWRKNPRQIWFG